MSHTHIHTFTFWRFAQCSLLEFHLYVFVSCSCLLLFFFPFSSHTRTHSHTHTNTSLSSHYSVSCRRHVSRVVFHPVENRLELMGSPLPPHGKRHGNTLTGKMSSLLTMINEWTGYNHIEFTQNSVDSMLVPSLINSHRFSVMHAILFLFRRFSALLQKETMRHTAREPGYDWHIRGVLLLLVLLLPSSPTSPPLLLMLLSPLCSLAFFVVIFLCEPVCIRRRYICATFIIRVILSPPHSDDNDSSSTGSIDGLFYPMEKHMLLIRNYVEETISLLLVLPLLPMLLLLALLIHNIAVVDVMCVLCTFPLLFCSYQIDLCDK